MFERKKRSGVMLCYPFEEKRLAKWRPPYVCQPKLDGVRCRAVWNDHSKQFMLVSSTEEPISSVPHINWALNNFMSNGVQPMFHELDGELYTHGMTFEDIYSITARTVNLHHDHERIQFHIFDYIPTANVAQYERTLNLMNLAATFNRNLTGSNLRIVPHYLADDFNQLMDHYKRFLAEGYEGIIVRHVDAPYVRKRATTMMKFKETKSDIYLITGVVEEHDKKGNPKGSLGALVCKGDDETLFKVGSGFTFDDRQQLWKDREELIGKFCLVKYQHLTPGREVPRFPIFCKIIAQPEELTHA